MKAYSGGKIVLPDTVKAGLDILVDNGKIVSLVPQGSVHTPEIVPLNGAYIAPGFIDIHCHGGGGAEFIDGTPEAYKTACAIHAKHGTRVIFPTVSATDYATMVKALEAAEQAKDACDCILGGVHLEGPYLSPAMTGYSPVKPRQRMASAISSERRCERCMTMPMIPAIALCLRGLWPTERSFSDVKRSEAWSPSSTR